MIYLDTSAFLKLYVRERVSAVVAERVEAQDEPLPIWDVLEAEFINAFHLKIFREEITPEQAAAQIELFTSRKRRGLYFVPELDRVALMDTFRKMTRRTAELGCRTMDILHVACALQLSVDTFMSFDQRQRALGRAMGLHVLPASEAEPSQ